MIVVRPEREADRLLALHALDVLDTPPEAELDALVRAAALVCGVPISLVSLVDDHRQWFKANVGLEGVRETPREVAFCAHAILQDELLEVSDARDDPRFRDNPLVTGAPDIRFYAGAPLRLSTGEAVGTLCVIDRQPQRLDARQRAVLGQLAQAAVHALEARRVARQRAMSQARFQALTEGAPLGVYATDAQGGCTYTNARWQQIFGQTEPAGLGAQWAATLHPEDRDKVLARWQHCVGERRDFDQSFRLVHADGSIVHVRSIARPVHDADGRFQGHVGSVEDITTWMQQDEALRRSAQMLQRTGELARVGGWELDLADGQLTWSHETCRIHGVAPGHRPTLAEALSFYAPASQPAIQAAVEQAMRDGQPWDLELPLIRRDGTSIWVRAVGQAELKAGRPVRLYGAFQDITARVQQHEALRAAQERMALATDSGGIGLWDLDLGTGGVTWNDTMYRLYGLAPSAGPVDQAQWIAHLHPEDREATLAALQRAIEGVQAYDVEFRIVLGDHTVHHIRGAARVVRDAEGRAQRLVGVNWDVTALRRLSTELAEQGELLHTTLQSIGDAVITTDPHGGVRWMNPTAERLTGWLAPEAARRPLDQVVHLVHEDTRLPVDNPVRACLQSGTPAAATLKTILVSRDGEEFGIEDSATPIRGADGQLRGAVLVLRDVTEQRRLSAEMSHRATHDALTGLVNRAEFETRLRRVLADAQEHRRAHTLLYIDLDQFKLVNDACGHAVGDELLQQVGRLLGGTVRSRDTLARLGGDEFGVILEHCDGAAARRVAQQVCQRMDDFRFAHGGQRFRIGASVGLVPVDARWPSAAAVLQAADTACYAAKEAGRNRVHAWIDTDHTLQARQDEMQWATRLEQALDEDRFALHAQRIVPLHDTAPAGLRAEVLLRLVERDGRLVPPGAFLPAAERFHLSSRIDRWVLRRALALLTTLPDLAAVDSLSINLSGPFIGDPAFHRHALELLGAAGPAVCRRICLEITETAAVTNIADAARFVQAVRGLGVRVALDDFGAGASSFGYLKSLPVDLLKIDGQFIRDLLDDPLDDAAVRCFVDVARVVGVRTVAEYVERAEVLQRLREIGVDYAQGFLLHRPQPIEQLLQAPGPTETRVK